jgi:hypothetical protein
MREEMWLLLPLGCRLLFDVVLASILSELESLPYYGLLFFPMGTWRHPRLLRRHEFSQ